MGNCGPMGCGPECGVAGGECDYWGGGQPGCDCSVSDGGCGPYDCGCGPCDMGCDVDCGIPCDCGPSTCRKSRFTMFGDFLYLQPTDVDVAHAQQQNGLGGAGTVPFGEIGTIGEDFNPGFRVGGSVACGPCSGVVFSFTHFESDSSSSLDAPVITGGGGAVGSLVHHFNTELTASAGPVDATYEIDYQLADVMCRNTWRSGCDYEVNYMVGAQFGHLDQDFSQFGIFGGGLGGAIDTTTSIDFDGGGLKAGVDAERRLKHGLGAYGRFTAAAMTGRFRSRYQMFNQSTDEVLARADWKDDRVVGQFECEVGMSLTSCDNHWKVSAGYMFSRWANVVTTPEFIQAVQFDDYVRVRDHLGFDGLVSRVECMW
jgi:Legionella pneumophila major outer membrane protein precursor